MLVCPEYIYIFDEVSVHTFCPFFDWSVCFLVVFKSSSYILHTSPLSDTCLANIFPQPVACLFVLLLEYFELKKTLLVSFNNAPA